MHILVAGGSGFIGSNLIEKLLSLGHRVTCLDDYSTGNEKNIQRFKTEKNFSCYTHDVRLPFPSINQVDITYNLASPASPPRYQIDPVGTLLTNVLGTLNALEFSERMKARFVQASTSEIYGDPLQHPQDEDYLGNVNTLGPRACYDEGKRAAETLCMDFQRQDRVDVTIFRIFNTYGPWMAPDDGRVVSNFITQALKNEPIAIYGDGSQSRSFCYIEDLLTALTSILDTEIMEDKVLNVGNPNEITMFELADKIKKLTNSNSEIEFRELPRDDPTRRRPDISRISTILNWSPTTPLDLGLEKTISYFKNY